MKSKEISNLILSLIILAIGIKVVGIVAKGYTENPVIGISPDLLNAVESLGNLFILGIGVLVLILLPFYFSKRSEENKQKQQ